VPVVPSRLLEPAWVGFAALLNERRGGEPPEFAPGRPWGCYRRRVSDRVVFGHVISALVHGSGYERIATPGCSDRTIRRRLAQWAGWGLAGLLHAAALRAYDQLIGLELADVAVDGCLTKAPCGGERAGPSPVDRRKGGLKRSLATIRRRFGREHGEHQGPVRLNPHRGAGRPLRLQHQRDLPIPRPRPRLALQRSREKPVLRTQAQARGAGARIG